VRHGTTTLFAALEVATGHVTDQCFQRHRHAEFLAFLKLVAKAYPRRQLHRCWTTTAPTPMPRSRPGWPSIRASTCTSPDLGELDEPGRGVLAIITRQAIRRGSFASVGELVAAIRRFVDGWNQRSQPFVWVNDADVIKVKATRKRNSGTDH
jgi:hypothetical protein